MASFKAKVVAISGNVAVVVDLRHPSAPAYMDPAKLGWLRDAAAMTDRLLLPTMRSLFDPDYQPPAGWRWRAAQPWLAQFSRGLMAQPR